MVMVITFTQRRPIIYSLYLPEETSFKHLQAAVE